MPGGSQPKTYIAIAFPQWLDASSFQQARCAAARSSKPSLEKVGDGLLSFSVSHLSVSCRKASAERERSAKVQLLPIIGALWSYQPLRSSFTPRRTTHSWVAWALVIPQLLGDTREIVLTTRLFGWARQRDRGTWSTIDTWQQQRFQISGAL